jgi:hypothetical protein
MSNDPAQIAKFISKYSPTVARQIRSTRSYVSTYFPRGYELIYDDFNALKFGFAATRRGKEIVVSVVAYPRWVRLFFMQGKSLSDPAGLLQGSGSRIRSVRLQPFSVLRAESVRDLIVAAIEPLKAAFAAAPPLTTIVKSVYARQLSRRPPPSLGKAAAAKPVSRKRAKGPG